MIYISARHGAKLHKHVFMIFKLIYEALAIISWGTHTAPCNNSISGYFAAHQAVSRIGAALEQAFIAGKKTLLAKRCTQIYVSEIQSLKGIYVGLSLR